MKVLPGIRRPLTSVAPFVALVALSLVLVSCDVVGVSDRDLEIIWPRHNATLIDEEYLEVRLRGYRLDEYEVYWYVDDSREERMWNEWSEYPEHKAYIVDTWYWDWRGEGPYTVGFIAEDHRGRRLAHRTVRVYVR